MLKHDQEAFFQKCDPGMPPLHLYGSDDGSWEVKPPEVELPAPEPVPTPGINLVRDRMERREWLKLVAVHCDTWLIRISSFAASYLTAAEQGRLFSMIIDLPMVQEKLPANHAEEKRSSSQEPNAVVEEKEVQYAEEKISHGPDEANEVVEVVYLTEEQRYSGPTKANEVLEEEEEEEEKEKEDDDDDDDNNLCASCNSRYKTNAFWIKCDVKSCGKWYHGKCVDIKPSEEERIKYFECPDCFFERTGRHGHL